MESIEVLALASIESFKCHYCVQGYHTAKERARHHHSHLEPYECHDCEYKNVRQDSLSKHLLKNHSKTVNVVLGEK